jgi:hypothetical protein
MSLAASTRTAFAVEAEAKDPTFRRASTESAVASGIEKVTTWIPSEVVTIYVALLGIFDPGKDSTRWILFAIGAFCVPVFVALNTALVNKHGKEEWEKKDKHAGSPPKLALKRIVLLVVFGIVAFVVWALALPSTPFLSLGQDATRVGGGLVVVVSLVMPMVAELLDLKVKDT